MSLLLKQKKRQQNALPIREGTAQYAEQPPSSGLGPHIHLLFHSSLSTLFYEFHFIYLVSTRHSMRGDIKLAGGAIKFITRKN